MNTFALVIGNDEYEFVNKLTNAVNDAKAIAEVFEKLQYDVNLKTDIKSDRISEILDEFEAEITDYDATIFYFAGHGFEIDGENYLVATDCQIQPSNSTHYYNRKCIRLNEILGVLEKYPNKVNIVIIDACRSSFDRSGNIGFSPIQAPKGTLLAFSTSPKESASDSGYEGHSIYTGSLLKYLGRENLFVEDLFKKVRKTVYNLSRGKQTSWEHTSLIGDFFFNSGQLIHSPSIPYHEKVVKDSEYEPSGTFGDLIKKIRTYDWHIQNPAIHKILSIPSDKLDKNEKFILGRNLLQASGAVFAAQEFMDKIDNNLPKYQENDENHLLNGILFEIYFDSKGSFRFNRTKKHYLERILQLRKNPTYKKSFEFISNLLVSTNYDLIYIPSENDKKIDIDIIASKETRSDFNGSEKEFQVIDVIKYNLNDITQQIEKYGVYKCDKTELKGILAGFFTAPISLIQINSNIQLTNCETKEEISDMDLF
ncbi:peptidase C14 [Aliifodinibius salipaludis]|uniref:Peptidase C14 n=1 Tax=Fodinibius salipaludis TaxID=2032627 RepID=A0A2A2G5S1_9BACT|nr:caspase family protein [Aliifodinibius salipaludis]PAU92648.1 peptidase C14 [Aliifodinibius salipaludis]